MFVSILLLVGLAMTLASDEDMDIVTEAPIPLTIVEVIEGTTARLPCDLAPSTDQDRVSLVIWYKDGAKTPIYSLDMRTRGLSPGRELKQTEGRMSLTTDSTQSLLLLEGVRAQDRGLYKCRVDFKHSPTRNAHVNLSVVVPPVTVLLTDSSGVPLPHSTLGPVAERSTQEVACISTGGWPRPRLTWWQDNDMIDDSLDQPEGNRVRNTLTIQTVTRSLHESRLECRASNSPLLDPIVLLLALDILLIPLDVRLVGDNLPLSAGSVYEVACRSVGSKPPPSMSWWRGGKALQAHTRLVTSEDGNITTSTVSLTASREDHGKPLSCRAVNPQVPASALEDSWLLDIHYRPVARVTVGSSLNASSIREGMDVYLECEVDANPPPTRLQWIHNSVPVNNNASVGVLLSNHTLVLQAVARERSGAYSCTATNTEGETLSDLYVLDIKYEPRCVPGQQRVYGAARLEEVRVSCDVDANPPATEFNWLFNNSVVQSRRVDSELGLARYTAFSETDYGTLLCWADNPVGTQGVPCVFHIVPAGVPDAPHNCSASARGQSWVHVVCGAGFDGGLPQQFTAEVWRDGAVVSNITSRSQPEFTLTSLEPGVSYSVVVYSGNAKGRSDQVDSFVAITLGHTQTHRRTTESTLPTMAPLMLVTSGIVIGVMLMVGIVLMVVVCLKRRHLQGSPDASAVTLDKTHSLLSVMAAATSDDDRNPDVIPQTEVETTLLPISCEPLVDSPWLTPEGISTSVSIPKEQALSDTWGLSVWPGNTLLNRLPVHRNAGTQTLQHKESTV